MLGIIFSQQGIRSDLLAKTEGYVCDEGFGKPVST
jgi:hypothetical protein